MDITIKIENLDRIQRAYARAPAAIGRAMRDAISKSAMAVEREAKISATQLIYSRPIGPSGYVRTGRLRNEIKARQIAATSLYAVVRSDVEYSHAVHEGKGSNRGYGRRPYMEVGAERAKINKIFNTHVFKAIKRL